ncbi:hypothetical protein G9L80_002191, partial [Neisseria gonorrhoeae]
NPDRLFGKWGGGLRACQIKTVFKRVAMRHMQGLEAQSIYYFHRNGRPRPPCKPLKDKPPGLIRAAVGNHLPPCKPLKDKPPGLIRAAVGNHLPLDLFKI